MKFDLEKFMGFEVGRGMSTTKCIKCAASYALGVEVKPFEGTYVRQLSSLHYYNTTNLFSERCGREFGLAMDVAELMLIQHEPVEKIKKFVMEEAVKAGIVTPAEVKEHACQV